MVAAPAAFTNIDILGAIAEEGFITPAALAANQNDWAPPGFDGARTVVVDATAARSITGIAGGADGRAVRFYNASAFLISLFDLSGLSLAANQIVVPSGAAIGSFGMPPGGWVDLLYYNTKWRIVGASSQADLIAPNGFSYFQVISGAARTINGGSLTAAAAFVAAGLVTLSALVEYANNAAALAGGLVAGNLYRTAGVVMIVI